MVCCSGSGQGRGLEPMVCCSGSGQGGTGGRELEFLDHTQDSHRLCGCFDSSLPALGSHCGADSVYLSAHQKKNSTNYKQNRSACVSLYVLGTRST